MKKWTYVLCVSASLSVSASAFAAKECVPVSVLKGAGAEVKISYWDGAEKMLVQLNGVDSQLNKLVLKYDTRSQGSEVHLSTEMFGGNFRVITAYYNNSWDWWTPPYRVKIMLPDTNKEIDVEYDAAASKGQCRDTLISESEKQEKSGSIKKLGEYNRNAMINVLNSYFKSDLADLEKACEKAIPGKINWVTVPDSILSSQKLSVTGYCADAALGLEQICNSGKLKEKLASNVKSFECQMGKSNALSFKDGTAIYTFNEDAANITDTVNEELTTALSK